MASADRRCFFYGHEIQKVAEAKSEKEKITELDAIKINEQAKDLVKQRLGEVGEGRTDDKCGRPFFPFLHSSLHHPIPLPPSSPSPLPTSLLSLPIYFISRDLILQIPCGMLPALPA